MALVPSLRSLFLSWKADTANRLGKTESRIDKLAFWSLMSSVCRMTASSAP